MYPLLAGAITLVLLIAYCRWIGDDGGGSELPRTDRAGESAITPFTKRDGAKLRLKETWHIPMPHWPTFGGRKRHADS